MPFYPHEFISRQSDLGVLDYSAMPVVEAGAEDFDPLEQSRLRQMIERHGGDRTLLGLNDEELVGALGFTLREGERRVPTVAGLLCLGRPEALRRHLPTHETSFQVLDGTNVKANDFSRTPLLKTFENKIGWPRSRDRLSSGLRIARAVWHRNETNRGFPRTFIPPDSIRQLPVAQIPWRVIS